MKARLALAAAFAAAAAAAGNSFAQTATASPTPFPTSTAAANQCVLVQKSAAASGTSDTLEMPAAYNFAGDLLIVAVNVIYTGGPAPAVTISDAYGAAGCLSLSCPPMTVPGGAMESYICGATAPANGATQITASNPAHNTIAMSAGFMEAAGSSYSLDAIGACAEGYSSRAIAPPLAPPHANDFVLGGCAADAGAALSASGPDAPWTALNEALGPGAALLPAYANGAAGSLSAAYSISPASPFICQSFSIYCGAAQPIPTPAATGAPALQPWPWRGVNEQ